VAADLASDSTIKREFGNLLAIKDNYPKVMVSADKTFENTYEGVEHIYIRDFLSSTLSHSIVK
jgi:predicted AAA+ superfamily ATPase